MKHTRNLLAVLGLGSVLALGGCWLDSKDDPVVVVDPPVVVVPPVVVPPVVVVPPTVPDSAGLSVASFISYLLSLSGSDESTEPLLIKDGFAVPADETSEPQALT